MSKFATNTCRRCGMQAVALLVNATSGCLNAGACAKRVAKNHARTQATERAKDAPAKDAPKPRAKGATDA